MAWAAIPAKSPRTSSVSQRRAIQVAGCRARAPNFAMVIGCFGRWMIGWNSSPTRASLCLTSGAYRLRHFLPSSPISSAVRSRSRNITPARPPSIGCTASTSGHSHSSPCRPRSSDRKNGEATPVGWVAEHTSCIRPGIVSSADRVPPPISSAASRTVVSMPALARTTAAASPLGPEPTTTAEVMFST